MASCDTLGAGFVRCHILRQSVLVQSFIGSRNLPCNAVIWLREASYLLQHLSLSPKVQASAGNKVKQGHCAN